LALYIKSKRQDRTGIGTLKSADGRAVTTLVKKAGLLKKQFKSVFTTDNDEIHTLRLDNNRASHPIIPNFEITVPRVYNLLSKTNINKSPGPDNIHLYFLKETANEIAPMLAHLFQQSLNCGVVPND